MPELVGARVLVAGGTSGLGRAMARTCEQTMTRRGFVPYGPSGAVPDEMRDQLRGDLLDPSIMSPPIVWLASPEAAEVHDERIVARDFEAWLEAREHT